MTVSANTTHEDDPDALSGRTIPLNGRFMLPDTSEHPCRVARLTIDTADFLSDTVVQFGMPIVAYLGELGRVVGICSQRIEGGFSVKFTMSGTARDKFAAKLKQKDGEKALLAHQDRAPRFSPTQAKSHIALSDGRIYPCEVLDISLSGAAVKADVMPTLGTYVALGKMRGRVVRYTDEGMAIEFVNPLDRSSLSAQLK